MRKTKSFDAAFCHELSIWEPAPHAETEDTNEDTTDAGMCYLLCRTDHWRWNSALRPLEYAETSTSLLVPSGQCQAQLPHVMFCTTLKVSPASTRLSPDLSARRGVAARNRTAKTAAVPWSEREKHVEFSNSEGNTLVGDVVESASSDTVVLCHGLRRNRNDNLLRSLVERLDAEGTSSLRFDFSGMGESGGPTKPFNLRTETEDIRSAVEYLRSEGREIVGLIGNDRLNISADEIVCRSQSRRS